jgi:hypothetical protein
LYPDNREVTPFTLSLYRNEIVRWKGLDIQSLPSAIATTSSKKRSTKVKDLINKKVITFDWIKKHSKILLKYPDKFYFITELYDAIYPNADMDDSIDDIKNILIWASGKIKTLKLSTGLILE